MERWWTGYQAGKLYAGQLRPGQRFWSGMPGEPGAMAFEVLGQQVSGTFVRPLGERAVKIRRQTSEQAETIEFTRKYDGYVIADGTEVAMLINEDDYLRKEIERLMFDPKDRDMVFKAAVDLLCADAELKPDDAVQEVVKTLKATEKAMVAPDPAPAKEQAMPAAASAAAKPAETPRTGNGIKPQPKPTSTKKSRK